EKGYCRISPRADVSQQAPHSICARNLRQADPVPGLVPRSMLRNRGRAAGHRPVAADRYHRGRGETEASSTDPNRRVDTGRPEGSGQGVGSSNRQDRAPSARLRVSKAAIRHFAPATYRSPAVRIWRGAHRLVVWFGAVAAILILVAAAGLWRLTQGPI